MTDEKIILFPTDRIVNKNTAKQNPEAGEKVRLDRTKEFVEGNVDEITMGILKRFVEMAMKTNKASFTKDLGLLVDIMRGMIYRDFDVAHPAQKLIDKISEVRSTRFGPQVVIDYKKVMPELDHKPHKPLNKDVQEEIKWTNDGWKNFETDFDLPEEPPEDDGKK
jgi:hypothetical protein